MQEEFVPYHQHLLMKIWLTNPPKEVDVLNKWFMFFKNYQNEILVVQVGPPKWGFWLKSRNPHFYIPLKKLLLLGLIKF